MYEFPFCFVLENGLPSSVNLTGAGGYCGNILYKCKAELHIPGLFKPNLKCTSPFTIHEPLRKDLAIANNYKEGSITFLCCIPRGRASMQVVFDKNAYAAGEYVGLSIIVDNTQSSVDLRHVSLKVSE